MSERDVALHARVHDIKRFTSCSEWEGQEEQVETSRQKTVLIQVENAIRSSVKRGTDDLDNGTESF